MKYPFPVIVPEGMHLDLGQGFHVATPTSIANALSIQTTDHLGVDVNCGDAAHTWGLPCVWPFPWDGIVYDSLVDAPFNAKFNAHAQIDGVDPGTGIQYSLIYIHLSSVTNSKNVIEDKVVKYKQGDIIGHIGNNGFVTPAPTLADPLAGSHLHLGLGIKKPGDLNYLMVDPLDYFTLLNPFRPTSFPPPWFDTTLTFGSHSPEIMKLQKTLQKYGFFPATQSITDYYGPITATAILKFRAANGVSSETDPKGYSCGPLTRAALNKLT